VPLGVCDASANVTYVIHVMALLRDAGRHGEIYCVVVSKERERERVFFNIRLFSLHAPLPWSNTTCIVYGLLVFLYFIHLISKFPYIVL